MLSLEPPPLLPTDSVGWDLWQDFSSFHVLFCWIKAVSTFQFSLISELFYQKLCSNLEDLAHELIHPTLTDCSLWPDSLLGTWNKVLNNVLVPKKLTAELDKEIFFQSKKCEIVALNPCLHIYIYICISMKEVIFC